jgi:hypothetical protein
VAAVAAHHDRLALELGVPEPFDGRDELVEVQMEQVAPGHGASIANGVGKAFGVRTTARQGSVSGTAAPG